MRQSGVALLAREAAHLTQVEAASAAGVSQSLISRLEGGHHRDDGRLLARLAEVYDVPVVLFDQRDPPDAVVELQGGARSARRMKPLRRTVASARLWHLGTVGLLDSLASPAPPEVPSDVTSLGDLAAWCRWLWPDDDPADVLEQCGVTVRSVDLLADDIVGSVVHGTGGRTTVTVSSRTTAAVRRRWLAGVLGDVLARNRPDPVAFGPEDRRAFASLFTITCTSADVDSGARHERGPGLPRESVLLQAVVERHRVLGATDAEISALLLMTPQRFRRHFGRARTLWIDRARG